MDSHLFNIMKTNSTFCTCSSTEITAGVTHRVNGALGVQLAKALCTQVALGKPRLEALCSGSWMLSRSPSCQLALPFSPRTTLESFYVVLLALLRSQFVDYKSQKKIKQTANAFM